MQRRSLRQINIIMHDNASQIIADYREHFGIYVPKETGFI